MIKNIIHIRKHRSNVNGCLTLCGERIHSIELAQGPNRLSKDNKYHASLMHQLYSCTMSDARSADNPDPGNWMQAIPKVSPRNPPIRSWHFCDGCWEHDIRSLHELKDTKI